jgi:hypothetical protein
MTSKMKKNAKEAQPDGNRNQESQADGVRGKAPKDLWIDWIRRGVAIMHPMMASRNSVLTSWK